MSTTTVPPKYKELVMTRVLDAPRELVFRCWTDPAHLVRWWGPKNWTSEIVEFDARTGGKFVVIMRGPMPGGQEISHRVPGAFLEITPPSRVVMTTVIGDEESPVFETRTTVTLEADGKRTRLTVRAEVTKYTPEADVYLSGQNEGWSQSLDRLVAEAENPLRRRVKHDTFRLERQFAAPLALVWKAWSTRESKGRWFVGPDQWERGDYDLDFRVGGRERLSGGPPGHAPHWFDATYLNIVAHERIVYAYSMRLGEIPISASLATIEFTPTASGTRLVLTEQGAFLDDFDGSGCERGTNDLMNNLEAEVLRLQDLGPGM